MSAVSGDGEPRRLDGCLAAVYRLGPQSRVSALMLEPGSCLLVSQQISITAHPQQAPQLESSLLAFAVIIGPAAVAAGVVR